MLCSQRVFLHIQVVLSVLCTCTCVALGRLTCFTHCTRAITGAQSGSGAGSNRPHRPGIKLKSLSTAQWRKERLQYVARQGCVCRRELVAMQGEESGIESMRNCARGCTNKCTLGSRDLTSVPGKKYGLGRMRFNLVLDASTRGSWRTRARKSVGAVSGARRGGHH